MYKKYISKIRHIYLRILIHTSFYVMNFLLSECRPNFTEVVCKTNKRWSGSDRRS